MAHQVRPPRAWRALPLFLATALVGYAGCVDSGTISESPPNGDPEQPASSGESIEGLEDLETAELVRRVANLPHNTVIVFDFDDTLLNHDIGDWSSYAPRAVRYLETNGINIAICSANANRNGALQRRLPDLNRDVFNSSFFNSPAFQVNSRNRGDREKTDEIQAIMDFYDIERDQHVVFFDDNIGNIEAVGSDLDLHAILVGDDALSRSDFRNGLMQLILSSANSCGDDVRPGDFCRLCGPCGVNQGDCDSDSECQDGLVCVGADGSDKDAPGHDICVPADAPDTCGDETPSGDFCSECGPCGDGQGDCDDDSECLPGLVCVGVDGSDKDEVGLDVCTVPVSDSCGDNVPPGDFCRECGPCREGQGDCDDDSECLPGLVCIGADGRDKSEPGHDICAVPGGPIPDPEPEPEPEPEPQGDIQVVNTATAKSQRGNLTLSVPSGTRSGDLLLLFLYRTDGPNIWSASDLRGRISPSADWRGPLASCAIDNSRGDFDCGGREADLNQIVYHKRAEPSDLGDRLSINMPGDKPGWAILVTVRGASTSDPLRASAGQTRCDRSADTIFPSVSGARRGDLLLLSQAFDDGANTGVDPNDFGAPSGTVRHAVVLDNDEAGHLYGRVLTRDGATGEFRTVGPGASNCKDAPMSLVIRAR